MPRIYHTLSPRVIPRSVFSYEVITHLFTKAAPAHVGDSTNAPSKDWIELLWNYLDRYWRKETPIALQGLSLLPGTFVSPSPINSVINSSVSVIKHGNAALEQIGSSRVLAHPDVPQPLVTEALQQLGCFFIRAEFALPISFLCESKIVQRFSLKGILIAFSHFQNLVLGEASRGLRTEAADALRSYAVSKFADIADAGNEMLIERLKALSIYPLKAVPLYLPLNTNPPPQIPPADLEDVVLLSMRPFVDIHSDEERVFYAKRVGVKQLEAATFVKNVLLVALTKRDLSTA